MLLYIYLSSIAFSAIVYEFKFIQFRLIAKKSGYIKTDKVKEITFPEKFAIATSVLILSSIPLFNLLVPFTLLKAKKDDLFDKLIKKYVGKGYYEYDQTKDRTSNEVVKDSEYLAKAETIFNKKADTYREVDYTFVSDATEIENSYYKKTYYKKYFKTRKK